MRREGAERKREREREREVEGEERRDRKVEKKKNSGGKIGILISGSSPGLHCMQPLNRLRTSPCQRRHSGELNTQPLGPQRPNSLSDPTLWIS